MYAANAKYYRRYIGEEYGILVKTLLDADADVHAKDYSGNTALMFAAKDGCIGAIQILINAQASVNCVDEGGRTALMIAKENNNDELIPLLAPRNNVDLSPMALDYGNVGEKLETEKDEVNATQRHPFHFLIMLQVLYILSPFKRMKWWGERKLKLHCAIS